MATVSRLRLLPLMNLCSKCHLRQLPVIGRATRWLHLSTRLPAVPVGKSGTPHWYEEVLQPFKSREELAEHLVKSVLYEDDDMAAVNKVNGIPMHVLNYTEEFPSDISQPPPAQLCVSACLPELKRRLNTDDLVAMFSQNRLYSGVVLFAKNEHTQKKLQRHFRHVRSNKVFNADYWAVTVGIPQPESVQEDMGVEYLNFGDYNMSIRVENPGLLKRKERKVIKPSFKYNVLERRKMSQSSVALVEISATATKWDSVLLYLLHKLSPVLGDHKYSSRLKTVLGKSMLMDPKSCKLEPQRLQIEMCNLLGLGEDETGHIPLHFHCKELRVPCMMNRHDTITIEAPLPEFFDKTLECLSKE